MPQQWIVIENTPGYMPDADEPFVTDDYASARAVMNDEVARYVEHIEETEPTPDVSWNDDHSEAYVVSVEREHDLGRVFSILRYEEEE